MSVNLFDVDAVMVRADYYPLMSEFSMQSTPTEETVTRWVLQEAGTLEGKLRKKGLTGEAYTDDEGAPFLWCQKTLSLMVALRPGWPQSAVANETALKRWQEDLDARLKDLDQNGPAAIGEPSAPEPDMPTHHIGAYSLDTGDISDASSAEPPFRKDDQL